MYCKLSLQDKFVLIFSEDIPLTKHRKVLGYYTEFKNAIASEQFYPIEPYGIQILKDWFWIINLIGKEIAPDIQWQNILPTELYRFFIAKVEKVDGNKIIVGRSELEILLGFTDKDTSVEEIPEAPLELEVEPLSTDDVLLDITTITLLNFKHGYQLLQTHSLSQLIKINEYANALQEKAQKEAEAKHSTEQHQKGKIGRPSSSSELPEKVKMTVGDARGQRAYPTTVLTNSWLASIVNAVVGIKKLNLRDKNSYYLKESDWNDYLEEAIELASLEAAKEAFGGIYSVEQLSARFDRDKVMQMGFQLLQLTYQEETKKLPQTIRGFLREHENI
ncbi:MAG: hypothetical protein QNJ65_04925 [Xenococcaceae cyanobacterium MO_234.B1]|nr:hypothetical protein [Xenococcaceae cyanobacterium MO_234.B1]